MRKYLIVGLGNIGDKYANTRHNVGFNIVEAMAMLSGFEFEASNFGGICQFKFRGRPVTLLKPDTYMNLSGNAVKYWVNKENISLENLMVITDDLNLPFGSIRIRNKGSDGGHNGLKDIQSKLNTTVYARLRFGIGDGFSKGNQVDYVIGEWNAEEQSKLPERITTAAEAVFAYIFTGINNAMNEFNGK